MEMPRGWSKVKLADLLTDSQCVEVGKLVAKGDTTALRAYLRAHSSQLEAKGVVADYLYYALVYEFELS